MSEDNRFNYDDTSVVPEWACDALIRTILYPLCKWDKYMKNVNAVELLDPKYTYPEGCMVRAVTFVSNPGSSVVQLELRREERTTTTLISSTPPTPNKTDRHVVYSLWLYCAKCGTFVFSSDKYKIDQLILLYLMCLAKSDQTLAKQHLSHYKKDTQIHDIDSSYWCGFDALLHHVCLYKHNGTTSLNVLGWKMNYECGNDLEFFGQGFQQISWGCQIRGPVFCYLTDERHHYLCPDHCERCYGKKISTSTQLNMDLSLLVAKYMF